MEKELKDEKAKVKKNADALKKKTEEVKAKDETIAKQKTDFDAKVEEVKTLK